MATPDLLSVVSRRAIIVTGIAVVSVVLGSTAASILVLRDAAAERARENLANIVTVLAEQTQRSLHAIDLVVSATAAEFASSAAGGLSPQVLHERLRERVATLPDLAGIAVVGPDGALINHSARFPPPVANYANRDYFPLHRDGRTEGLYLGAPVQGKLVPGWQQTYSRRIEGPKGEFLGVVSAGSRIDQAHSFYRSLRLGAGGRVGLFRTDGLTLNFFPPVEGVMGRSFAKDPLFSIELPAAQSGVRDRPGFVDSDPRMVAYERLRDYPAVVTISSTQRHALADWREGAVAAMVAAVGVSLIVGIAVMLLLRQQARDSAVAGELVTSGERLHGIIQSAMDGVITVNEDQKIVLFNTAAERIFGCPAAEAVGGRLDRFIPARFHEAHRGHIERFGQTGTTTRRMGARLTLHGLRTNGEEFPIDASISQVQVAGRKLYTVILRDVTEAKEAETALQAAFHARRTANEQLLGIIQSAMDAIITIDSAQRIVVFNETAARMFRCRPEEAIGGPLERFIPERFRAVHRGHVERFGETRVTAREMGARLDLFGLRADGEEFPIDASISQVTVDGERFYTVILRDVSERRRADEALERSYSELRELSRVMNEVREAERTRVARELHDELAQWLTALKMDIAWLSARLPAGDGGVLDRTERMKKVVDTTVASVRRIAADLRPVMLDDLGLVPSIEHLLQAVGERANLAVALDVPADGFDFRDPLATSVYRMVQEALTNVARHAGATEVRVTLAREGDALLVRVADNGVGLQTPDGGRKSYGLLGIRERAQTLGGQARIYSPPEGGTVVEILIPLARFTGVEVSA